MTIPSVVVVLLSVAVDELRYRSVQ